MILRGMSGHNIRGSTPFLTGTAIKKGGGPTVHTSERQPNRGQRMRELLWLSRLADVHSRNELRDPTSPAHHELIGIPQRLARRQNSPVSGIR